MQLIKLTKPIQPPFDLETAKVHTRIDQDTEDAVLEGYLAAAVDECARYMQIAISQQDYQARFDCWPCAMLWLPMSPIVAVSAVKYLDEAGDELTLSADDWSFERRPGGGFVYFASDYSFPTLAADKLGAVRVNFTAGFDSDDGSSGDEDPELEMPAAIRQAVFLTFAHYYAHRESVDNGRTVPVPRGAEHLMDFHRVYR